MSQIPVYTGRSPVMSTLFSLSDDQVEMAFQRLRRPAGPRKSGVDLLLVIAGNQPFALLMSQIYNLVRPGPEGIEVVRQPNISHNRQWGEVLYHGSVIRVVELPLMLRLPLVEPIHRSRVLLSGDFQDDGTIENPFGIAIEDILFIRRFPLDDIRVLPRWIARDLNGLVWGALLAERELLQSEAGLLNNEGLLQPVSFGNIEPSGELPASPQTRTEALMTLSVRPDLSAPFLPGQSVTVASQIVKDTRRPVMILNLEVLKNIARERSID